MAKLTRFLYLASLAIAVCLSCKSTPDTEEAFLIPQQVLLENDTSFSSRNGVLYAGEKPYSGFVHSFHANDSLKSQKGYLNGLLEGSYLEYWDNGDRQTEREYHLGEKVGLHQGWYANGNKKYQYYFEKGMSSGCHKEWYPGGEPYRVFNYQNGKQRGSQQEWFKSGKLKANYVVKENGRKYGLTGVKRCTNINTKEERLSSVAKK